MTEKNTHEGKNSLEENKKKTSMNLHKNQSWLNSFDCCFFVRKPRKKRNKKPVRVETYQTSVTEMSILELCTSSQNNNYYVQLKTI